MNKTLTTLGLGACVLVAFTSCQSTDGDGYSGTLEEATPMSEMAVADGEIPPWLLEDDGSTQIDAGARTPDVRNQYAIPDPGATVADSGASHSSRQNQPAVAAADQDDITVETPTSDVPLVSTPPVKTPEVTAPRPHQTTSGATTSTTPRKPSTALASSGKGGKASTSGGKRSNTRKGGKRVKEPTLVIYKVRPGDNLSDIAKRSHTTVAQIRKDSNIKGSTIYPGQTIKVRYTPKDYKPKAGSKGTSSAARNTTHVVSRGETISGIAKKNGVTPQQILKANNMSNSDAMKIRPGKRLIIPGKQTVSNKSTNSRNRKGSAKKRRR